MSRKDGGSFVAMNDMGFFNVKNDDTYGINKRQKRKKGKKFKQLLTDKAVRRTHVILNHTRKNAASKPQTSLIQAPQPIVALFDSFLRYLSSNPALRPLVSLILNKDVPPPTNEAPPAATTPSSAPTSSQSSPAPSSSLGHLAAYGYSVPRQ